MSETTQTTQTAKAELEMRLDHSVPQGVLSSADGRRFPFSGWTELAAAIERWRFDARDKEDGVETTREELR